MTRLPLLAVIVFLAGFVYRCTPLFEPTATVRVRITLDVQTPDGIVSGSVVRELSMIEPQPRITPWENRIVGEALEVRIGEKGSLFALTDLPYARQMPGFYRNAGLLPDKLPEYEIDAVRLVNSVKEPAVFEQEKWNLYRDLNYLWLSDRNDVNTAKIRWTGNEKLSDLIGPGYELKRLVLQITNDPITTEIKSKISWLKDCPDAREQITMIDPRNGIGIHKRGCFDFDRNL